MKLNKTMKTNFDNRSPFDEDLKLINAFTQQELTADGVYSFSLILCDNELDRDFERFDRATLEDLAPMFVGKAGLYNHSMDARDQTARLYSCHLVRQPGKVTAAGEEYAYIKARAYMPRTAKNADLIEEIRAGIKKEVSVGCAVKEIRCSVCGADFMKETCSHKKGQTYGGKICHGVLSGAVDAYEWSFVAVPAQRAAGVTKRFESKTKIEEGQEMAIEDILKKLDQEQGQLTLEEGDRRCLKDYVQKLQEAGRGVEAYREDLLLQVIKMGRISLPGLPGENLSGICKRLSIEDLCSLKAALADEAKKVLPPAPQLKAQKDHISANDNKEFKI
ncbi:MAG: hypothetical protein GX345_07150 [Clostridiales bacterium]|nr:hypothetical protein [Clostridiales bacterium]